MAVGEVIPRLEREIPNPLDDRLGVLLHAPYSEELNATLKEIEPRRDRHWAPELEGWWAAAEHEQAVVHAVLQVFGRVMLIGRQGEPDEFLDRDGTITRQEGLFD